MTRFLAIAIITLACGQSSSSPPPPEPTKKAPEPKQDTGPVRILFIGNSYTYAHDLPVIVERLAIAGGRAKVKVDMIASGGVTLQAHWDKEETRRAVRDGHWTYVVLQEQSTLGIDKMVNGVPRVSTDEVFRPAALQWAAEVKKSGATPVFYLTWARRVNPEDQALLTRAYMRVGRETAARVAPVGIAWADVRRRHPDVQLFESDGAHPAGAGSYLAACALYATIFDRSPEGLPATLTRADGKPLIEVPAAEATLLQAAAAEADRELDRNGGYLPEPPAAPAKPATPAKPPRT